MEPLCQIVDLGYGDIGLNFNSAVDSEAGAVPETVIGLTNGAFIGLTCRHLTILFI